MIIFLLPYIVSALTAIASAAEFEAAASKPAKGKSAKAYQFLKTETGKEYLRTQSTGIAAYTYELYQLKKKKKEGKITPEEREEIRDRHMKDFDTVLNKAIIPEGVKAAPAKKGPLLAPVPVRAKTEKIVAKRDVASVTDPDNEIAQGTSRKPIQKQNQQDSDASSAAGPKIESGAAESVDFNKTAK